MHKIVNNLYFASTQGEKQKFINNEQKDKLLNDIDNIKSIGTKEFVFEVLKAIGEIISIFPVMLWENRGLERLKKPLKRLNIKKQISSVMDEIVELTENRVRKSFDLKSGDLR